MNQRARAPLTLRQGLGFGEWELEFICIFYIYHLSPFDSFDLGKGILEVITNWLIWFPFRSKATPVSGTTHAFWTTLLMPWMVHRWTRRLGRSIPVTMPLLQSAYASCILNCHCHFMCKHNVILMFELFWTCVCVFARIFAPLFTSSKHHGDIRFVYFQLADFCWGWKLWSQWGKVGAFSQSGSSSNCEKPCKFCKFVEFLSSEEFCQFVVV